MGVELTWLDAFAKAQVGDRVSLTSPSGAESADVVEKTSEKMVVRPHAMRTRKVIRDHDCLRNPHYSWYEESPTLVLDDDDPRARGEPRDRGRTHPLSCAYCDGELLLLGREEHGEDRGWMDTYQCRGCGTRGWHSYSEAKAQSSSVERATVTMAVPDDAEKWHRA